MSADGGCLRCTNITTVPLVFGGGSTGSKLSMGSKLFCISCCPKPVGSTSKRHSGSSTNNRYGSAGQFYLPMGRRLNLGPCTHPGDSCDVDGAPGERRACPTPPEARLNGPIVRRNKIFSTNQCVFGKPLRRGVRSYPHSSSPSKTHVVQSLRAT